LPEKEDVNVLSVDTMIPIYRNGNVPSEQVLVSICKIEKDSLEKSCTLGLYSLKTMNMDINEIGYIRTLKVVVHRQLSGSMDFVEMNKVPVTKIKRDANTRALVALEDLNTNNENGIKGVDDDSEEDEEESTSKNEIETPSKKQKIKNFLQLKRENVTESSKLMKKKLARYIKVNKNFPEDNKAKEKEKTELSRTNSINRAVHWKERKHERVRDTSSSSDISSNSSDVMSYLSKRKKLSN